MIPNLTWAYYICQLGGENKVGPLPVITKGYNSYK